MRNCQKLMPPSLCPALVHKSLYPLLSPVQLHGYGLGKASTSPASRIGPMKRQRRGARTALTVAESPTPRWARSVLDCGSPLPLSDRAAPLEKRQRNRVITRISNPNGIMSSSPGLRGTRYPGCWWGGNRQPQRGCGLGRRRERAQPRWGWPSPPRFPRVARASQPWALSRNPFEIRDPRLL